MENVAVFDLGWYRPRLPGVKSVAGMEDRELVLDVPWAVGRLSAEVPWDAERFPGVTEEQVLDWYHRDYLRARESGARNVHTVRADGSMFAALADPVHEAWCRERLVEGARFEPYHWNDPAEFGAFTELYGERALVRTSYSAARQLGDKGWLRKTAQKYGVSDVFAPHELCETLEELKEATQRMLRQFDRVRVVFDGQGASGDGAAVFEGPLDADAFDAQAKMWVPNRDPEAPFLVEQWFEGALPLSITARVDDEFPVRVGVNLQYEKRAKGGVGSHAGNFTCSTPSLVVPDAWRDQHGWTQQQVKTMVHNMNVMIDVLVVIAIRLGWDGPIGFDLILLPDGRWYVVECNGRNYGSLFGSNFLKQERARLGGAPRCVATVNIEGLPPSQLSRWVAALRRPKWRDRHHRDGMQDLDRPNGSYPWALLMLPRSSMTDGKIVALVSAETPDRTHQATRIAVDRIRRAAKRWHSDVPEAK